VACNDGTLATATDATLGFPVADAAWKYTTGVAGSAYANTGAVLTATLAAIGTQVTAGQTVVWTGTCSPGGMSWVVGGTVSPKYYPKT
jgi:hypothetical protein